MSIDQIISTLTVISTFSLKLIGFPSQIKKIQQAGHIEGVSITYFVLAFITYTLWTLHGVMKRDYTIIIGQGLGVLASGALLIILYLTAKKARKKNNS